MKETTMNSIAKITLKNELGEFEIMGNEMVLFLPVTVTSKKLQELIDQTIEKEKVRYLEEKQITDRQWSDYGICVYSQLLQVVIKDEQFEYFLHFYFMDSVDTSLSSRIVMEMNLTAEDKEKIKMPILQAVATFFGL